MRVVSTTAHLGHAPLHEFADGQLVNAFEIPERAETIRRALEEDGGFAFAEPTEHGTEPILAVHDEGLLRFLETVWRDWHEAGEEAVEIFPDMFSIAALREGMGEGRLPRTPRGRAGQWGFDTATPIVEGTYDAARSSVDVGLTAADLLLDGEDAVYGLCRPPGHHAARAMYGGYCFFNNAAIVAEDLVRRTGGAQWRSSTSTTTTATGRSRSSTGARTCSTSRSTATPIARTRTSPGSPRRREPGRGEGANLNLPLPLRCDDDTYLRNLDRGLEAIVGYGVGAVIVSLGIDTYERDPICDLAVTTAGYHEAGRRVAGLGTSVLVLQEGGYFVPHLGENVRNWLLGLEGRERDLSKLT